MIVQTVATYPISPPFTLNTTNTNRIATNTLLSINLSNYFNYSIANSYPQKINVGSMAPGQYVKGSWEIVCKYGCSNFTAQIEGITIIYYNIILVLL